MVSGALAVKGFSGALCPKRFVNRMQGDMPLGNLVVILVVILVDSGTSQLPTAITVPPAQREGSEEA